MVAWDQYLFVVEGGGGEFHYKGSGGSSPEIYFNLTHAVNSDSYPPPSFIVGVFPSLFFRFNLPSFSNITILVALKYYIFRNVRFYTFLVIQHSFFIGKADKMWRSKLMYSFDILIRPTEEALVG